jgi:NADH:quinone reductase (non-electrogenic)
MERRPGGAKFEDVRELVSGARGRKVYELGDPDYGIWSAGIAIGLINDIPTCEELIQRLESDVEKIVSDLSGLVQVKSKL